MTDDKIIKLPTDFTPDQSIGRGDLDKLNIKLDVLADEILMLSKTINQLLRGLATERKQKK